MYKGSADTLLIGPRSRPGRSGGNILILMNGITALPGAAQIATGAIHRSIDNLRKDANVVARSTDVTSRETIGALVDSRQQVLYTAAAAKLINASDEMIKSLLDVHA
jgi:hypothetical protein